MTIEVADRLQKLRKEKGYSQEELADALGISRQAVSKWERAESSPDTDNLILLARLYGMSLDDILSTDESTEEIKNARPEPEQKAEEKKTEGITLTDDEGQSVKIENGHIKFENADGTEETFRKYHKGAKSVFEGIVVLLTVAGFFIWGFCFHGWKICWVLFILMPAVMSIFEIFQKRKITAFAYPCLAAAAYLFIGMKFGMWHPWWMLFLTVPAFYVIFTPIDKYVFKSVDKDDEKEDKCENKED